MKKYQEGKYTIREYFNGTKEWRLNGKIHREGLHAREWDNGDKDWYIHGKLVFDKYENNISDFNISKEMKLSIIKYKLTL